MYPYELDGILADVSKRRCASCHSGGIPRKYYTRMLKPENNSFLLAPLAKTAGGTEKCGKAVFESKDDPDYQKIINVFQPIRDMLEKKPRMDMIAYETSEKGY